MAWQTLQPRALGHDEHATFASTPPGSSRFDTIYENNTYYVAAGDNGHGMRHLVIVRHDGKPIRTWATLQHIKDDVCGPDCEAVEIFPAHDRRVDRGNVTHLWALPPGERFPFGMTGN